MTVRTLAPILVTDDIERSVRFVEVIYAPDDFDYGMREFGVGDDNGYALAFGAPSKSP